MRNCSVTISWKICIQCAKFEYLLKYLTFYSEYNIIKSDYKIFKNKKRKGENKMSRKQIIALLFTVCFVLSSCSKKTVIPVENEYSSVRMQ